MYSLLSQFQAKTNSIAKKYNYNNSYQLAQSKYQIFRSHLQLRLKLISKKKFINKKILIEFQVKFLIKENHAKIPKLSLTDAAPIIYPKVLIN